MRSFRRLPVTAHVTGDLLIGGHSETAPFLDSSTAREVSRSGRGKPIIPASALKGALREATVRLVRGRGKQACLPFDEPCGPNPCLVCRLFGRPGPDRPGEPNSEGSATGTESGTPSAEMPGSLWFEDLIADSWFESSRIRHGVGVDRKTGHASDGLLFVREVAGSDSPYLGAVCGWLTDDEVTLLRQACLLLGAIGNSRSRGLGAISITLGDAEAVSPDGVTLPEGEAVLVITAESDLHFGDVPDGGNFKGTTRFIPGSAIQGALAAALVRGGVNPQSVDFKHLLATLSVSDAWPTSDGDLWCPAPRTLFACPVHDRIVVDRTAGLALAPSLLAHGGRPAEPARCTRKGCTETLRRASGVRHPSRPTSPLIVDTRIVTRLALDPTTRSAAEGMLFSREQIEAHSRFSATVSGLDATVRGLLAQLRHPIRLGGMRGRGLGRVRLNWTTFDSRNVDQRVSDQGERISAVTTPVRELLGLPEGRWLELVARTPMQLPGEVTPASSGPWLGETLFPGRQVRAWSFARAGVRSGWDGAGTTAGPRPFTPVLRAGAVWLLLIDGEAPLNTAALVRAETAGVGEGTKLGLGRLCAWSCALG